MLLTAAIAGMLCLRPGPTPGILAAVWVCCTVCLMRSGLAC